MIYMVQPKEDKEQPPLLLKDIITIELSSPLIKEI